MSKLNFLILLVILSTLILTRLFDVQISATQGLSIKNIVLYLTMIVIFITRGAKLSIITRMPAIIPLAFLFFLATLSMTYAPLLAGDVVLDTMNMMLLYKNEVLDTVLFYFIGFMLITKPMGEANPLSWIVASFGVLNIIALSVFVTGINPFSISVMSHEGSRFASYGVLANQGAYALLFFFPLNYYFYEKAKSRLAKIFFLVLMITSFIGVVLTGSKGGYLLTIALCLILMIRTKKYRFFILLIAAGLVGVVAYSAIFGIDFLLSAVGRMSLLLGSGGEAEKLARQGITGADAMSSGRTIIWNSILDVLTNDPIALLIGKGWGTYSAHILHTLAGGAAAHNVFLKVLFQVGLLGLSLLLFAGWKLMVYLKYTLAKRKSLFYQCVSASFLVVVWTFMLSAPINLYAIWAFSFGLITSYAVNLEIFSNTGSQNSIRGHVYKQHGVISGN